MIRLTRGDAYTDKIRAYKIFIDDVHCGDINRNETKEFVVDDGIHVIYAKIDWCRSNKLCVNVDNSTIELEIGPSLSVSDPKFWFFPFIEILYITIYRNKYLWIKKKEDAMV